MDLINERHIVRDEREYHDKEQRPGREGQSSVGHRFLTRAALTKTHALYARVYGYAAGVTTPTEMGLFGASTWGDATFKEVT